MRVRGSEVCGWGGPLSQATENLRTVRSNGKSDRRASPGFPVDLVGVGELLAAFLNESRTRGCWRRPVAGNPGPPDFSAHVRPTASGGRWGEHGAPVPCPPVFVTIQIPGDSREKINGGMSALEFRYTCCGAYHGDHGPIDRPQPTPPPSALRAERKRSPREACEARRSRVHTVDCGL
jgi:hypothetical protein